MSALLEILTWVRRTAAAIAPGVWSKIRQQLETLRGAVLAPELLGYRAQLIGETTAATGGRVVQVPLSATAIAGTSLLAGSVRQIWRQWTAIVASVRSAAATISCEVMAINRRLAWNAGADLERFSNDGPGSAGEAPLQTTIRGNGFASVMLASIAGKLVPVAARSLNAARSMRFRNIVQPAILTAGRTAATVLLTTPLLVTPTMANISFDRASSDPASAPAMVFNSQPTIVINACKADDIEQRVVDALRQHREAIYIEWSRELQRRQRTEF